MTYRPSSVTRQHRLHSADPVRTARARLLPTRLKAPVSPERAASSGSSAGFETVSGACLAIRSTPDAAAAATGEAVGEVGANVEQAADAAKQASAEAAADAANATANAAQSAADAADEVANKAEKAADEAKK